MSRNKIALCLFGTLLLVVGFQNCAPKADSSENNDSDPVVTAFDDKKEGKELQSTLDDSILKGPTGGGSSDFSSQGRGFRLIDFSCTFTVNVVNSSGQTIGLPRYQGMNSDVAVVNTPNVGSLEACVAQADMGTVVRGVCHTEYVSASGVKSFPDRGVIKISYERFSIMDASESGSFTAPDYEFDCRYF